MSDDWPAAGTLLAFRYRLVSRLETGGMAEIWHAQDELLARPVALKLPTGLDRARSNVLQLAWKEARMGARLSHPNIAAVHDYDEAVRPEGSVAPFVVMELLAGETLAARLACAPLPWREAAGVGAAVADALTAAHASGVVHRDVKPGNVMLTPTGVKILDFGISAVTGEPDDDETGATFGTPAYVAPERLDGKPAEPATDVYGLGVLLFEMVTGQPPYPVDTWEELARARAQGAAALPSELPPAFRELVTRCLVDEPDRRPSAAEVGKGLAELAEPEEPEQLVPVATVTGHRAEPGGGGRPGSGRRRLVLWSSLVALVVSALALFAAMGTSRSTVEAGRSPAASPPPASLRPPAPSAAPRPSAQPATKATPRAAVTTAAPPLDADVAQARFRTAVEDARADGQIRPDIAVDLLNLLRPLDRGDGRRADDQVAELRRKLNDRIAEGSVDGASAKILRARLADLDEALRSS
ncbi:serine/threonine-protein kinase [Actinoplanes sp. NPDC048967]|uniref:serine/threonine-protein kinase n=1 Tax=Actinoplanes sp. NPDC048967 TaxID=3155269 RepID=UPI0033C5265A